MSIEKIVRLSKASIGDMEKKAVLKVLDSEFLGMGKEVQLFEDTLSMFFRSNVACVVNGTAALQLALQACGIKAGDEVLVQSLTYVASFQAISAIGAIPVPCEVIPETLTIDINDARKKVTPKTKAIMPVHYAGGVGDIDKVYELAKELQLRVIEDAAHAFGTLYKERNVGSFGDVVCFSFDGIKNITSGEGGCIVSKDEKVINKINDLRLLGVHKDTEKRFKGERSWIFHVKEQGWRYHMSNIMATIGTEQFKRFPDFKKKRQEIARKYFQQLSNMNDIELLKIEYDEVVPHIFVIKVKNGHRDSLKEYLQDKKIQTGIHYMPNHHHEFYYNDKKSLPITDKIFEEILTLPLHVDLTEEEINLVITSIKEYFKDNE